MMCGDVVLCCAVWCCVSCGNVVVLYGAVMGCYGYAVVVLWYERVVIEWYLLERVS